MRNWRRKNCVLVCETGTSPTGNAGHTTLPKVEAVAVELYGDAAAIDLQRDALFAAKGTPCMPQDPVCTPWCVDTDCQIRLVPAMESMDLHSKFQPRGTSESS